jgi:hypothetical protein
MNYLHRPEAKGAAWALFAAAALAGGRASDPERKSPVAEQAAELADQMLLLWLERFEDWGEA